MTFPTQPAMELPLLLEIHAAGGALRPGRAYPVLTKYFPKLTPEDLGALIPSGQDNRWQNSVRWTRQTLVGKGEIYREPRGNWRITPKGRARISDARKSYDRTTTKQMDPEKRRRVEEAAIEAVMRWEKSQGRRPLRVDAEKRGYDIKSRAKRETRFIEVKGLSGTGPVEMTPNEIEQAQRLGEQYYLYVVEHALERDAKLYFIRNPAANCLRMPSGWAVFWQEVATVAQ